MGGKLSTQIVRREPPDYRESAPISVRSFPNARTPHDDLEADPIGIFQLIVRRRKLILWTTVVFLALAAAACIVMPPSYRAGAQIELLPQQMGAMAAGTEVDAGGGGTQAEDALNFALTLQTQVSILQSEALALRVIKELNLIDTPGFRYNPPIKTAAVKEAMALPIDQSPKKRSWVLKTWSKNLKVEAVSGTRVVSIQFSNADPNVAAQVVNQLVKDYVDFRFQVRSQAMEDAADRLNQSLDSLKNQATSSSERLADIQQQTGLYGPAPDQDHNIILSRLEELSTAATDAQRNREAKETIYNLARSSDPELVAGLVESDAQGGANNPGTSTPTLLVSLHQQEAQLNTELAEASAKYGSDNPKLLQIRSKVDSIRGEIKAEANKVVGRAQKQYLAAAAAEQDAEKALNQQKEVAAQMNAKTADYGVAKNQADSALEAYQRLLEKGEEASILAGVRSTDISIVSPAIPPGKPHSPVVPLYLGCGAFAGLLCGVVGAFLRDALDSGLRNPEDIEEVTRMPVLGVIPRSKAHLKGGRKKAAKRIGSTTRLLGDLAAVEKLPEGVLCRTDSDVMEAFRAVRSSIVLSRRDNPHKIFLVTSALPQEGKSFSALHLATTLAQNGNSVLLVDADLRRGTLSMNLKRLSSTGLSTTLSNFGEKVVQAVDGVPGLAFFPAGEAVLNPSELLGSPQMARLIEKWRNEYDFVVMDAPPILPVTDAVVLSAKVDGVIVVSRYAVSTGKSLQRTIRILTDVRAKCFGILVNSMDISSWEYKCYGGYGSYGLFPSGVTALAQTAAKEA